MNLHYFQHVVVEGLAQIEPWARRNGFTIRGTQLHLGQALPHLEEVDWLVVMGGPMNIYEVDRYPWLRGEKRFIGEAIAAGRVVLGVCLGAQLIADVLGAAVTRNAHTEIGWFPLHMTPESRRTSLFAGFPASLPAFHWHTDTFTLPPGAALIASSEPCQNQIFQFAERVVGLQCHLEENEQSIEYLLTDFAGEMVDGPYVQTPEQIRARYTDIATMNSCLNSMLDNLLTIFA